MRSGSRSPWLMRSASLAARLVGAVFVVGVLCGGTCSVYYHSDHHCHDGDDHCHDGHFHDHDSEREDPGAAPAEARYRMEAYRVVPAMDPSSHPVARILDITGPALAGSERARSSSLYEFTGEVIRVHPGLLGLPVGHPDRLVPTGIRAAGDGMEVLWTQARPFGGSAALRVPRTLLRFRIAADGRLVEIEQRLRLGWSPFPGRPAVVR